MPSTTASDSQARLEATLVLPESGTALPYRVRVQYRLVNLGDATLAVFDRGDGEQPGVPRAELRHDSSGTSIVLGAESIPDPAPVSPVVPRTRLLEPETAAEGEIEVDVPATWPAYDRAGGPVREPVQRLRFCLAYARFSDDAFVERGRYWVPTVQVIDEALETLCTPWFDLAQSAYEGEDA